MNCIPGTGTKSFAVQRALLLLLTICGLCLTGSCSATDAPEESTSSVYAMTYHLVPQPENNQMRVELTLKQARPLLKEMRMHMPADYFGDFAGDGDISFEEGNLVWTPPERGGALSWTAKVNRLKTRDRYDAYMSDTWAIMRTSDVMPPAATRTLKDATSKTSMKFSLPNGWSSVTQYKGSDNQYEVNNANRRFDRATGWILLGKIGIRTEEIAGVRVKIAAPKNHDVRRMDMLALLAWTLPDVTRLFSAFPERLTIISGNDPLWRGGLSAPSSMFIHASLPLISENGTSAFLHEIVHIGMRASATDGADWIIEGMAEYYGLQLLLRSGTIVETRYHRALDNLKTWGDEAPTLCGDQSNGAVTARATWLMHDLDQEIRKSTKNTNNLDDVMNLLARQDQAITIDDLTNAVSTVLPSGSKVLDATDLSGCTS